jgi:hypothetical protein
MLKIECYLNGFMALCDKQVVGIIQCHPQVVIFSNQQLFIEKIFLSN